MFDYLLILNLRMNFVQYISLSLMFYVYNNIDLWANEITSNRRTIELNILKKLENTFSYKFI